ncbi:MAG: putative DNA binding domain-containing protein, partial [Lachnospiraceae bacterium]|nr:putative DNA binding domain-containing protein [Lachnospiraceae bacterium]
MALVNLGPETEVKEYKKSIGEIKEGIISIASILNKHGSGELYFGVTNDGTVLGQEIGDETLRKVSQAIGYHVKPPIYPEICVKEFDGRKTVYVKFKGDRQPYLAYNIPRIRVADEDLVMDQDMYDSLLRQRDDKRKSWESQLSGYTAEDVDMEAFQSYLKKAREAGRITFDTDDKEIVLKKLKLMSGRYLLNAGAALFCKTDINELKMATFATNERLTFTDIRIYSGSIIELADKAEKYVLDAMHWRAEIVGMKRVEIPEIPPEAVREAIINSFAHRVIESGQSNEVAIFKNRIEIYNYGTFPAHMTPEQYFDGNEQPVRRNPLIAGTLYYSKDMENFATGLKRIYDACESAGCRVEFQKKTHGFCVVFYRRGYEESIEGEDKEQERNQAEPTGSQAEPIGSQA